MDYAFRLESQPVSYNPEFVRRIRDRRRQIAMTAAPAPKEKPISPRFRVIECVPMKAHEPGLPATQEIIAQVAAEYGFSVALLIGDRRTRRIVDARDAAIRRLADLRGDLNITQIGKAFGGRDHSSIIQSLRRTERREFKG